MAEIHIEKKRPPIWRWVLAVALVLVVGWIAMDALRDDDPAVMERAGLQREGTAGTAGGAVPARSRTTRRSPANPHNRP